MAVSRRTGPSDGDILHTLQLRLKTLEDEHESKQLEFRQLYAYHGNKCVVSLTGSVKSLFEVIQFVRKADKKLIDWHYRSDKVKTALRWVGLDRRTHAVIEKKTQQLHTKVQRVEKKFDQTGAVFDGGLQEAKRMKSGFLEFSTSNVGHATQELSSARDIYGQKYEQADTVVELHSAEHRDAQLEADWLNESLNHTIESHNNAEFSRNAWSLGTLAGVGAAAVSTMIFPVLAVPLLAASAAAGSQVLSSNEKVQTLQSQRECLALDLSKHDASFQEIKAKLATSSRARDAYGKAIAHVEGYQEKCRTFVAESQDSLNELYAVQVVLEKIREKLRVIATELHECRYEVTRRGIATRLRGILGELQRVPKKIGWSGTIDYDKATQQLMEIDGKTKEVLKITMLSSQAQAS